MLNYVALGLLIFVALVIFYGIIALHDIPYEIAKKRNHPHQDAIHVAGWVSLFTLHVIWPFLWIWATLYRKDRGWGFRNGETPEHVVKRLEESIKELNSRLQDIERAALEAAVTSRAVQAEDPAEIPSSIETSTSSNTESN